MLGEYSKSKRQDMRKLILCLLVIYSCGKDPLPKPQGYLQLTYPNQSYIDLTAEKPYSFKISDQARIVDQPNGWLKISYPKLKASIDITYRPVNNNLKEILLEAEKLVFKHTIKADEILTKDYENSARKVYGSLYYINGNAASNLQFHATDSTKHFIKGSLYFYAKPNYDSILPAISYIKEDLLQLMETLEWKN